MDLETRRGCDIISITVSAAACSHCRASLPPGAGFCPGCGAPVVETEAAPGMQPSTAGGDGMRICSGCGAIAPSARDTCEVCSAPLASAALAPAPAEGGYWAQITAEFQCRGCGAWSPHSHPDVEGTVQCARCELIQAYDVGVWGKGLSHAHEVADLAGPGRDQFKNAYSSIGRAKAGARIDETGMEISDGVMRTRSLRLTACPGHPLCERCRAPLATRAAGEGKLDVECQRCGDTASYEAPGGLRGLYKELAGVLADDCRTDRPDARLEATAAGAIALSCPRCSAALEVQAKSHFATCAYCQTTSRIASKTLTKLYHEEAAADPWWIYLQGPSPGRQRRIRQREKQKQKEAERAAAEAEAARPRIKVKKPLAIKPGLPLRLLLYVAVPLALLPLAARVAEALNIPTL